MSPTTSGHRPFMDESNTTDKEMEDIFPSQVLNTQEEEDLLKIINHTEFSPTPEFIIVDRRKKFFVMIPASAVCAGKPNLRKIADKIQSVLAKFATIIGQPVIRFMPKENEDPECFVVIEVGSGDQCKAACKGGFTYIKEDGSEGKTNFQEYTETAQVEQESRVVRLKALAWNTKASDIHAAMKKWGPVQSVSMGFNAKKTMATAVVIFKELTSVQNMLKENITWITIAKDAGAVAQLGTQHFKEDRNLTKKLAHLPEWYTPLDVVNLFRDPKAEGKQLCRHITMPVDPISKRRHPEAFVYFNNEEDWQRAKHLVFNINGKKTIWVDTAKPTCRTCGHPEHMQKECQVYRNRKELALTRKANTQAMQQKPKGRMVLSAMANILQQKTTINNGNQKPKAHFEPGKQSYSSVASKKAPATTGAIKAVAPKSILKASSLTPDNSWRQANAALELKIQALGNRIDKQTKHLEEMLHQKFELYFAAFEKKMMGILEGKLSPQLPSSQLEDEVMIHSLETESQSSSVLSGSNDSHSLGEFFTQSQTQERQESCKPVIKRLRGDSNETSEPNRTESEKLKELAQRLDEVENLNRDLQEQNELIKRQNRLLESELENHIDL